MHGLPRKLYYAITHRLFRNNSTRKLSFGKYERDGSCLFAATAERAKQRRIDCQTTFYDDNRTCRTQWIFYELSVAEPDPVTNIINHLSRVSVDNTRFRIFMLGQANRSIEPGVTIKNVIFKNSFTRPCKTASLMHSTCNLNIINIHTFGGFAVKTR